MCRKNKLIVGILAGVLALAGAIVYASGTSLSVNFGTTTFGACDENGNRSVTFNYTVTSTGAADAATVTAELDGTDLGQIQFIAAGNVSNGGGWTFAGRSKSADGSFTTTLAAGSTHTLIVCATQHGSNGNPDKTACNPITVVVPACESSGGCAERFFGEIPHNKNLCGQNANVQIQFGGDFGEEASLEIFGPNGYSKTVTVPRAGNSCNYHYNWETRNDNGGAGEYTFTVTGNGQSISYVRQLACEVRGNPNQ